MRIGKKDVDVEVRRLMLSYLNGIQVFIVTILFTFNNLKKILVIIKTTRKLSLTGNLYAGLPWRTD